VLRHASTVDSPRPVSRTDDTDAHQLALTCASSVRVTSAGSLPMLIMASASSAVRAARIHRPDEFTVQHGDHGRSAIDRNL
jgi:hypothetical protein